MKRFAGRTNHRRHPGNLLAGIHPRENLDPGLRHAGVTSGFSLVELMIALMILGLIAVCSHDILSATTLRLEKIESAAEQKASLQTTLNLLKKDLRSAYLSSERDTAVFAGRREEPEPGDRIDFVRVGDSKDTNDDIWEIGYGLEQNSQTGRWELWRRVQTDLDADPLSGGRKILLCPNVTAFDLRYFDGDNWQDSWCWNAATHQPYQGIRGLPVAISIHLSLQDENNRPIEADIYAPVMTALLNRGSHG